MWCLECLLVLWEIEHRKLRTGESQQVYLPFFFFNLAVTVFPADVLIALGVLYLWGQKIILSSKYLSTTQIFDTYKIIHASVTSWNSKFSRLNTCGMKKVFPAEQARRVLAILLPSTFEFSVYIPPMEVRTRCCSYLITMEGYVE